jgi:hypothetical protein
MRYVGASRQPARLRLVARRVIFAIGVVAVLATVALAPAGAGARSGHERDHGTGLGPGCAPDRPAVAHHAGGVIASGGNRDNAPIPCMTTTGFRTSEVSIAVTNDGSVLVQPAVPQAGLPIGVLRSTDQGASWTFINPSTTPPRTTAIDMNMQVDRQTGRVFWSNDLGPPIGSAENFPRLDISGNDGQTWAASSQVTVLYDHTQIFTGPPTERLEQLMQGGYPNVVYVAVSGGFTCATHGFCGTHIAKSLDGGLTFGPAVAIPYPPGCLAPGVNPTGGYGLNGVVARDGTVYLPFTPCELPYIATSHDEGATWQLVRVANTETIGWGELGLGIDERGNLYAAWTAAADRLLYLAISRDHGLHWSKPLMIAAPGVNEAAEPELVAGPRGQVAVSYYGSTNAPGPPFPPVCGGASVSCPGYQNETWNTYITETRNPLGRHPLFWSATLNDPTQPTWYGVTPSSLRQANGFSGGSSAGTPTGPTLSGRIDYFGMAMAPDGTPWVGFVQECPFGQPVPGNPNCPSTLTGGPNDGLFGLVGRLIQPKGSKG